jgi:hypothetical protein
VLLTATYMMRCSRLGYTLAQNRSCALDSAPMLEMGTNRAPLCPHGCPIMGRVAGADAALLARKEARQQIRVSVTDGELLGC